ncbi:MAG: response regulator [Bacteroidia bacterium]|nr:response regulator [Bacteroidia bacterium]
MFKKVMVIDDSEIDRYIATYNIKKYGFAEEVIESASASEALQYLKSFANTPGELPDFIFLDIRMPEMDGFEFLAEYEKLSVDIKEKCICMMLSASLDPADYKLAKENKHLNRFINKPLDKKKLNSLAESVKV